MYQFLYALTFYCLATAFSSFGTRGSLLFTSIIITVLFFIFTNKLKYKNIINKNFLILSILIIIATLYAVLVENFEFSLWQVFRSQIWTLISIPIMYSVIIYTKKITKININNIIKLISYYVILLSIGGLIDLIFGLDISPAYIKTYDPESGNLRIYLIGVELISPVLPLLLIWKKYIGAISALVVLGITGGKASLISGIIPMLFAWYYMPKNNKNNTVMTILAILFTISFVYTISDRIASFTESGDIRRWEQISDGVNVINKNPLYYLWGIGYGTPYSNAYFENDVSENTFYEQSALLENARFDIENGYIYLLARMGFLGTLLYILSIGKSLGRYALLFWILSLIGWLSGSPSGPQLSVYFISFGFGAIVFKKYYENLTILRK